MMDGDDSSTNAAAAMAKKSDNDGNPSQGNNENVEEESEGGATSIHTNVDLLAEDEPKKDDRQHGRQFVLDAEEAEEEEDPEQQQQQVVHDQLPNVEEYKANTGGGTTDRRSSSRQIYKRIFVIFSLIVMVIVFVCIGVVVRDQDRKKKNGNNNNAAVSIPGSEGSSAETTTPFPTYSPPAIRGKQPTASSATSSSDDTDHHAGDHNDNNEPPTSSSSGDEEEPPPLSPNDEPTTANNNGGSDSNDNNDNDNDGDNDEETAGAAREYVRDFVVVRGWSRQVDVDMEGTPQRLAVEWLAHETDRTLNVPISYVEEDTVMARYVLAVVYYALRGDGWTLRLNWLSSNHHVCEWNDKYAGKSGKEYTIGVFCQYMQRVTHLFIPGNGLEGEIPPEIGLLGSSLTVVDLTKNQIEGSLPEAVGNCTKLTELRMDDNLLEELPTFLNRLVSLEVLSMARNQITNLPTDSDTAQQHTSLIGMPPNLRTLNLNGNRIHAHVAQFQDLPGDTLEALFLEDNAIAGTLTDHIFSNWPNLRVLDMSSNELKGDLPSTLFNHTNLVVLDLSDNFINGTMPVDIAGSPNSSTLQFLDLHSNDIKGPMFPAKAEGSRERYFHYRRWNKLAHLDLSSNSFTGKIPGEAALGALTNLRYLFLSRNRMLTPGTIPAVIGSRLTNLKDLSLKSTNRRGTLPQSMASLTDLVLLDLHDNQLQGPIPTFLGNNLTRLRFLLLNRNMFNGTIPNTLNRLVNLRLLLLDKNNITSGTAAFNNYSNPICQTRKHNVTAANMPVLPYLRHYTADCKDFAYSFAHSSTLVGEYNDDNDTTTAPRGATTIAGSGEVACPCCNVCCSDLDESCNAHEWLGAVEPSMDVDFVRDNYIFDEGDVLDAYGSPFDYNNNNDGDNEQVVGALNDDILLGGADYPWPIMKSPIVEEIVEDTTTTSSSGNNSTEQHDVFQDQNTEIPDNNNNGNNGNNGDNDKNDDNTDIFDDFLG